MTTDNPLPANPVFLDLMTRLHLDEHRAAQYLGVPVFTLRKWLDGTRVPSASVLRLVEVLGIVEALAPALHASLLPEVPEPTAPRRRRGRPRGACTAPQRPLVAGT